MIDERFIMQVKGDVISAACGIYALSEEQLLDRLQELWLQGFSAGGDTIKDILQGVSDELSKIVTTHIKGDPDALKAVLDDFVARHVKFVTTPIQKQTH